MSGSPSSTTACFTARRAPRWLSTEAPFLRTSVEASDTEIRSASAVKPGGKGGEGIQENERIVYDL